MTSIVDYGAGNLRSIERALVHFGDEPMITGDPDQIRKADAIIFPGVGNARAAMEHLRATGIADAMTEATRAGTPLIGVCLGMQLLFGDQEEGPTTGIGLLDGVGVRLPGSLKVPHMGWNTVRFTANGPLADLPDAPFYFVHSYVVQPADPKDVAGETDYGITFPSVVVHENVWGMQFHPEKSGDIGLALLQRWLVFARSQVTA
ncbi:MAG TPA: imidazole glycerol phosphate synthase subunit HisH [Thermomicrobiales bacterium]|nr:imidazole glycerol phosphate synthase subunit HisH [Thermomicrobiales bacterium]